MKEKGDKKGKYLQLRKGNSKAEITLPINSNNAYSIKKVKTYTTGFKCIYISVVHSWFLGLNKLS